MLVYNYKTGEILAKVSAPTFDPNAVPEDIETNEAYKGAYLDNTLSGSFTPGSIFKIVTAAAAMENTPTPGAPSPTTARALSPWERVP